MKKNLLLVILLLLVTFMTGCNKEDKTVTCTIKKIDSTTTITISRVSGKVTITKDEGKTVCVEDVCRYEGTTTENESTKDLNILVEQYRMDGYYCE